MTTEVLTPENTFLWTSNVRKDTLPWCHKKSLAFNQIPARMNKTSQSHKRFPDFQTTFNLQSVQDRQLKKLQWSDCNPIALIYTKINQL